MQHTEKQNYSASVVSYDTRPGNKIGLFCNTPEPTRSNGKMQELVRGSQEPLKLTKLTSHWFFSTHTVDLKFTPLIT